MSLQRENQSMKRDGVCQPIIEIKESSLSKKREYRVQTVQGGIQTAADDSEEGKLE